MSARKPGPIALNSNRPSTRKGTAGAQRVPGPIEHSALNESPSSIRRSDVWFVLYYEDGEKSRAFLRAAETEARRMEGSRNFGPCDIILLLKFITEADFEDAWAKINRAARERLGRVKHGVVLSHAGTSVDDKSGNRAYLFPRHGEGRLYTVPDPENVVDLASRQSRDRRGDGTFSAEEIARLPSYLGRRAPSSSCVAAERAWAIAPPQRCSVTVSRRSWRVSPDGPTSLHVPTSG